MFNRYLLFCCPDYYPHGGMGDCKLKTDNLDDIVSYINENYNNDLFYDFHCYDIIEDKTMDAVMETYNEGNVVKQKFICWS